MKNYLKNFLKKTFRKENLLLIILSFLAIGFIVAGIYRACMPYETLAGKIERADYGEDDKKVILIAEAEIKGSEASERTELIIEPGKLSKNEREKAFEICKKELHQIILGNNKDVNCIIEDMNLITYHEETGIEITWKSGNSDLINDEGSVYPGKSDDNGYVLLTAELFLDGETEEWKCNVRHRLKLGELNVSKALKKGIEDIQNEINSNNEDDYVSLPKVLNNGLEVKWKIPTENNYFIYGLISLFSVVFLYSKRKSDRKKTVEKRKQEIEKEFPYFLDKLMMLLSAGLILSEAVERITDDYLRYSSKNNKSIFYEELALSVNCMKESNSSFSEELMKLSQRLDIREFARLSVILRDSISSGMDMVSKLEEESILIWGERKSAVQKLGRTADTKLVFPLIIILVVLIVIVMAPAVLQM